jgi:hypothetical protein
MTVCTRIHVRRNEEYLCRAGVADWDRNTVAHTAGLLSSLLHKYFFLISYQSRRRNTGGNQTLQPESL